MKNYAFGIFIESPTQEKEKSWLDAVGRQLLVVEGAGFYLRNDVANNLDCLYDRAEQDAADHDPGEGCPVSLLSHFVKLLGSPAHYTH